MSDNVAQNDRDAVIQVLSRLPADATLDHIRYEFETIFGILEGLREDDEGIPHEVVMAEVRAHIEAMRADSPAIRPAPHS
jgi:hypothetical protein